MISEGLGQRGRAQKTPQNDFPRPWPFLPLRDPSFIINENHFIKINMSELYAKLFSST